MTSVCIRAKRVAAALLVLCLVLSFSAVGQPFNAHRVHKDAFELATTGAAYDAAVLLIDAFRECPADDTVAESLVAPGQLLGFIGAFLMDWPERRSLQNQVLDPETYPTDRLLIAVLKAGSEVQGMAAEAYGDLVALAQSDHLTVRITALSILASAHYYPTRPMHREALAELLRDFPQVSATRYTVEGTVLDTLGESLGNKNNDGNLLRKLALRDDRRERALAVSPLLRIAAEHIPALNAHDINDDTITAWAQALQQERDPETRYALLRLLKSTVRNEANMEVMRPVLRALTRPVPRTADEAYAQLLLARYDCHDRRINAMRGHIEFLMPRAPLPCTPARNLYEESLKTAQNYAAYFTRYGYDAEAVRVRQAIAARYPGTSLAEAELRKVEEMLANPLEATLDVLDREARRVNRQGGNAAALGVYEDAIANTENTALQQALEQRIQDISE